MPGQRLNRNQHTPRRARWRGRTILCTVLGLLAPAFAMAGTTAPAVAMTLPVVSSGGGHSCALMPDQSVWCWGHNNTGQLGNFSENQSTVPVQVPTIPAAIGIAAGYGHSCAIDTTNIIWCWGSDAFGELGNGTTKYDSAPGQVMSIKASQVSAGNGLTCAVSLAHKAYCWGDNNYGELGDGTNSDSSTPKLVKGLTGVQAVAAGYFHACALLLSGAIYCWGDNTFGALGDGTTTDRNTPVLVIEGGATAIAGGFDDTCAILSGGDLKCWGDNGVGELGDGTDVNALVPTQVSGLTSGVSQVTLGEDFTCALAATPTTTALCWGDADGHGELGNGSFDEQDPFPTTVFGLQSPPSGGPGGPEQIAAGAAHACVVVVSAKVECWGQGLFGNLGNGSTLDHAIPTPTIGLPEPATAADAVSSGGYTSCAVTVNLNAACWGQDPGNGTLNTPFTSAVPVPGLPPGGVGQVSADYGGCAVTVGGAPLCWGDNTWGEVGNGTATDQASPVPVTGLPIVETVTTGGRHTCALVHNDGAFCWGDNSNGDVGDGTTTQRDTPVAVKNLPANLAQISAGGGHTCALLKDGSVKCWGSGATGDLGDGSTSDRSAPVAVSGLSGVVQIALGQVFSCALTAAGSVSCWGYNTDGELGNGTTTNSDVPVGVSGLSSGVVAIVGGDISACALLQSGQVDCWGGNVTGQLGDGTTTGSLTPVGVGGFISDGASIAMNATGQTVCSLNSSEEAECWGGNYVGQLGDGSLANSTSPVPVNGL